MSETIAQALQAQSSPVQAAQSAHFFKTGKGEYGEGDVFIGVTVPVQRMIARRFKSAEFDELQSLLDSPVHEHRLTALLILVMQSSNRMPEEKRREIVEFYLKNLHRVNNWDLVDSSAQFILGEWLQDKPRDLLYRLAKSGDIWKERVAIIATHAFIRVDDYQDTLDIAKILVQQSRIPASPGAQADAAPVSQMHDLIQKAIGWMLREVGNRNLDKEVRFLKENDYPTLPRTLLRYAIEKFEPGLRKAFMEGTA